MWRATVLTLFPEMFPGPLGISLAGKALASNLWALETRDIRDAATDKHRSVDDTPAGGGPGMVLRADVLAAAIDAADIAPDRPRLLMSPRGTPLTQKRVMELAVGPGPLIVCGRLRASISGSSRPVGWRKSPSGTTCSQAEKSRRWPFWTPVCGFCQASWAS